MGFVPTSVGRSDDLVDEVVVTTVESSDVLGDDIRESLVVIGRVAGVVRRDEHVAEVPQRVCFGERFGVGHVERRAANVVPSKRPDERVGVDDGPAGDIHDDSLGGKRLEGVAVYEVFGGVGVRAGEDEIVALREGVVDGVEADYFVRRPPLLGRVPNADGVDAEPGQSVDDSLADCAEADNGDRRVLEFCRLEGAPLTLALSPPRDVEAAGEREHRADRVLGDVRPVDARGVRHRDPRVGERVSRQVVGSGPGAGEHGHPGVESFGVDAVARHDTSGERPALLVGGPCEDDLVVGESFAERGGVLAGGHPVDLLPQDRNVRWCVAHTRGCRATTMSPFEAAGVAVFGGREQRRRPRHGTDRSDGDAGYSHHRQRMGFNTANPTDMSMERVDVVIVGGGPAGSSAAHAAAKTGASALVLEKGVPRADRPDRLGPDSTDAAGILDYWVDIMGIHPDEFPDGVLLHHLDRAEFIGPNESVTMRSTGIESSYDHFGYCFNRARFDDFLRDRAESKGAEYRVGVSVRDVETTPDASGGADDPKHLVTTADGTTVGADFLVLADGPQRTVTNKVLDRLVDFDITDRLASTKANHIAYQEHREFPEEVYEEVSGAIKFWWGYMPGHTAYPWVFPNDDNVCRVGLTMPIGLDIDQVKDREKYELLTPEDERIPQGREYIRRLLEQEYGDEYDIEEDFPLVADRGKTKGTETYPISSTRPIDSPVASDIAVVGGAMGSTSAFHEGGDHVAVRTGAIAGRLAGEGDLSSYNRAWKDAINDEILRNVAMADIVHEYGPDDWDWAFKTARKLQTDEGGYRSLSVSKMSAGVSAARLVGTYKKRKFKFRNGKYVQIREDEYRSG